ncbi:MAG: cell division protein FtsZ [Succinivibrio sp.]
MSDIKVENEINLAGGDSIAPSNGCRIKVLGVGGAGCNALQYMIDHKLSGVECIAVNTDRQTLSRIDAPLKIQIGAHTTNGLGAGCDPNKGRSAAEESYEDLREELKGAQLVFITAGMGGGTGTGASPIIAKIAKELGALTIAVVSRPFSFEGKRHMINAKAGISELYNNVDSIIISDNDKLLKNLGANISLKTAFEKSNEILYRAVHGITSSISDVGLFNIDFADVVATMKDSGLAMIGSARGKGPNLVEETVNSAINSPLVDEVNLGSASGLIANIRLSPNLPVSIVDEVCSAIQSYAREDDAICKFGIIYDSTLDDGQIDVTILVTGISSTDGSLPSNQALNHLSPLKS